MILHMNLGQNSYDIIVEKGILSHAYEHLSLARKILIVTDDGVPTQYSQTIASFCKESYIVCLAQGEDSKSYSSLQYLHETMLKNDFSRSDAVVAVGGGVVGDLAGFAAATFMRGIDFYNVPTTLLSMVDSSIGGKTAINYMGIKNCIGAFHQPKRVLIDPEVLQTLPQRQIANGLAEAIKMAATFRSDLFSAMESENILENPELVIIPSLTIKKHVVEEDEKESGVRRVLNFGHTIGHGIESCAGGSLYHGECVALGMLPMCSAAVRERLINIFEKTNLPTELSFDYTSVYKAATHDKKRDGDYIRVVFVPEIGSYEIKKISVNEFQSTVKEAFEK